MTVDIRDVRFDYPSGTRALDGITLRINDGERVAFIGQNGSGKTTLVKHFNGLLRPTSGTVMIDGLDIRRRRLSDLARSVGFAFQNPDDQIFRASVAAEVAFGPQNLGLRGHELEAAVAGALDALGLAKVRDAHPYTLNYAMRKLVSIAGVVAMRTPILVLDEPTTGQDQTGVRRIEHLLDAASLRQTTVVVVTHDMAFVARNFARVVVMSEGKVRADGPPGDIFWRTEVLAAAGLEPPTVAALSQTLGGERFWTIDDAERVLRERWSLPGTDTPA